MQGPRPPHRTAALAASLIGLTFVLAACAKGSTPAAQPGSSGPPTTAASPAFPVSVTDDDGVAVTIPAPPQRIVTFAPSNTEILFALGLGSRIVGVSGTYDNYPSEATGIQQVGGAGEFGVDPNLETVVSLHPDLFLTISGGDQWKAKLRKLGVTVVTVNATDLDDLLNDIRTIGTITGASAAATTLTADMQATADRIKAEVAAEPAISCFFEAYYPPLTSVGPNTFIFDLLERAGCDPVTASARSDYPEWSVDQLVKEGPAVYLVASESGVSVKAVGNRHGFDAIAAVGDGKIYLVNSDLVSRPGPRVVDGLLELAKDLHPEAVTG